MEIRKGNKNPWINRYKYYLIIILNIALLLFNFAGLKLYLNNVNFKKYRVREIVHKQSKIKCKISVCLYSDISYTTVFLMV